LPKPFWPPHSGHPHVIPLQDKPQKFSFMQAWQILNPQRHRQQKGTVDPQHWQVDWLSRQRCLYRDMGPSFFMIDFG
jgi:hypothetical protein